MTLLTIYSNQVFKYIKVFINLVKNWNCFYQIKMIFILFYMILIQIMFGVDCSRWKMVWSDEFIKNNSLNLIDVQKWKTYTLVEECEGN